MSSWPWLIAAGWWPPRCSAARRPPPPSLAVDRDRRWSWTLDGTLVPTRDHTIAARSKNHRWSTNAQVLSRRADLAVVAITGGGPGNRIARDHAWQQHRRRRARAEHTIARLTDWQALRDHRRRGTHIPATLAAVAYLHNTKTALRASS